MLRTLRTVILIGAVLVGIAAVIRLVSNRNTTQAAAAASTTVQTATIDVGDVPITVNATGTIQAHQTVSLAFLTSGVVTSINVNPGDHVLKGQTVATIDNLDEQDALVAAQLKVQSQQVALNTLNTKPRQVDIDVDQASINAAQASLKEASSGGVTTAQKQSAQVSVEQAKNQLWQSELNRDITNAKTADLASNPRTALQALSQPSGVQNDAPIQSAGYSVTIAQDQQASTLAQSGSSSSIASAEASLSSAQAQLNLLMEPPNTEDVKQAQANLDSAKSALTQAQASLDKTKLIAPFDGVIATVDLNIGENAPSGTDVVLLDTSSFYVDLPVAELDIANVQVGQPVNLLFDALPNTTINGKVTQVASTSNGDTPVTYNVRVEINPAGQPLLSTMSTTASIITNDANNVIRIPNNYIRIDRQANKEYASVKQPDGTFQDVQINVGTANATYTEVKSGLHAGDIVAIPSATATAGRGGAGLGFLGRGG